MQSDFDTNYPHLNIQILGINGVGYEGGNAWFTSNADIPWLQDADTNGDSAASKSDGCNCATANPVTTLSLGLGLVLLGGLRRTRG